MKSILDVTAGGRQMWFNKNHPEVIYVDRRVVLAGVLKPWQPGFSVEPDVVADFTDLPFEDASFRMVVFDPPHAMLSESSIIGIKYGSLGPEWQNEIQRGFQECWRVLGEWGVLIFKWNESQVKVREVLNLLPEGMDPLFGHPTGKSGSTKWITFMKIP